MVADLSSEIADGYFRQAFRSDQYQCKELSYSPEAVSRPYGWFDKLMESVRKTAGNCGAHQLSWSQVGVQESRLMATLHYGSDGSLDAHFQIFNSPIGCSQLAACDF